MIQLECRRFILFVSDGLKVTMVQLLPTLTKKFFVLDVERISNSIMKMVMKKCFPFHMKGWDPWLSIMVTKLLLWPVSARNQKYMCTITHCLTSYQLWKVRVSGLRIYVVLNMKCPKSSMLFFFFPWSKVAGVPRMRKNFVHG